MTTWNDLAKKAIDKKPLTREECLAVLASRDEEILELVSAARRVREKFFEKRVKLNFLVNVKSGICPEDCHYCSQSKDSKAPIPKYPMMTPDEMIQMVERGLAVGARRACLVGSGRGPSEKEIDQFTSGVSALKAKYPELEVCACLGLLKDGQANQLQESGVHAYNHNINTSKSHYEKICGTHGYDDRLETIQKAQSCGMQPCSGILVGMNETDEDIVEMALTLRTQKIDSIPVNFLVPVESTPLGRHQQLTPEKCLKILALVRFVNPDTEIRMAGGRELNLRTLQPLGLMIANSIFIGDYLTTKGQSPEMDLQMIQDLGYEIQGHPRSFLDSLLKKPLPEFKKEKMEEFATNS